MNPEAQIALQFSLESYSSYIQRCTIVHFRNQTKSCVHFIKGTFSDSNNNNNNTTRASQARHQSSSSSLLQLAVPHSVEYLVSFLVSTY